MLKYCGSTVPSHLLQATVWLPYCVLDWRRRIALSNRGTKRKKGSREGSYRERHTEAEGAPTRRLKLATLASSASLMQLGTTSTWG